MTYNLSPKWLALLRWAPRILGLLFAAFVSLFALDVFDAGYGLADTLVALFMHLIPVYVLLGAVALGWRRPLVGGLLFVAWGVGYVATVRGFDWIVYALLGGLPVLIGLLFLADFIVRRGPPHGVSPAA